MNHLQALFSTKILCSHEWHFNLLPHRDAPFNAFANSVDADQTALVRVCSDCLWKYDISDPKLVDLTINFFVLCTNMNVFYIIIHSGWSLA